MLSFHLSPHLSFFLLWEPKKIWTVDPLDIQLTYLYLLQCYDYTGTSGTSGHAERSFFEVKKFPKMAIVTRMIKHFLNRDGKNQGLLPITRSIALADANR